MASDTFSYPSGAVIFGLCMKSFLCGLFLITQTADAASNFIRSVEIKPDASQEEPQMDLQVLTEASKKLARAFEINQTNCDQDVDRFLREDIRNSLDPSSQALLEAAVSAVDGLPIVLVNSKAERCLADNFLVQAHMHAPNTHIVYVSLDQPTQNLCLSHAKLGQTISCVDFSHWLPLDAKSFSNSDSHFGTCITQLFMWTKPFVLLKAAAVAKKGVLFMDADIVLFNDMLPRWIHQHFKHFDNSTSQIMAGTETTQPSLHMPNTGIIFANRDSSDLLEAWVSAARVGDALGDQQGLFEVIKRQPGFKVIQIPPEVVGECHQGGTAARHYNCAADPNVKGSMMRKDNLWQPTTASCQ